MQAGGRAAMAIPRVFNSNTPFVIVAGGSELSFLGREDGGGQRGQEDESLAQAIAPHLSRVMEQGTAELVSSRGRQEAREGPHVSIVAQAESEDFQEFSPTNTKCVFSRMDLLKKPRSSDTADKDIAQALVLPQLHLSRSQRRKSRMARRTKEEGEEREEGEEPPIIRGLWVQEIDWFKPADVPPPPSPGIIPPPPQFTDSVSDPGLCQGSSREASPWEDRRGTGDPEDTSSSDGCEDSDCDSDLDSSCCSGDWKPAAETGPHLGAVDRFQQEANESDLTFDLMGVSGFDAAGKYASIDSFTAEPSMGTHGLPEDFDLARPKMATSVDDWVLGDGEDTPCVLRGRVSRLSKRFVRPFFDGMIKQADDKTDSVPVNEGLLFHADLQPRRSKYREGEEYCILHHVQNGSYGDVFCVRDKKTGFQCAAKRVPLSHFSSEEVSAWSALSSPRVVELFGAVREGNNVVLFMDLKPTCLAHLLREMKSLPEDLALHHLHQTLEALEHLHHKQVLHLDVKVDNVLLSVDCRESFLCDFGLSETLDSDGRSTKACRGAALPGTETHMAPEVVRGGQVCAKADVWSSCCMLLHMLNGCPPWVRFYSHPLCLQIVKEPPPLWEVPSNCNNFTAKVFRAGLKKIPQHRASAKELKRKTTKALRAVGGLDQRSVQRACEKLRHEDPPCSPNTKLPSMPPAADSALEMSWVSPWRTKAVDEDSSDLEDSHSEMSPASDQLETGSQGDEWACQPKSLHDNNYFADAWNPESDSEVDIYMGEEEYFQEKWLRSSREYEGDWEEEGDDGKEWDSSGSTGYCRALRDHFPLLQRGQQTAWQSWGSEAELEYLRDGVTIGNTTQNPSPEPRDDPPSCFSCSDSSQMDASEQDSDHWSDDLSSGVFSSCNSQTDRPTSSPTRPPSLGLKGVDIWIENVQGDCLRIHEQQQVKVGHVAIGISDKMCGKIFTLETVDGKAVSFAEEILESCLWLRCVPAPDRCQRWRWRIKDGKLEIRE